MPGRKLVVLPALALLVAAAALGCGSGTAGTPPVAASKVARDPSTTKAQIVSSDDDPGGTGAEVFERAKLEMAAGKLPHARVLFDRVVAADDAERAPGTPPSSFGRAAAYNAALCSETLGDTVDARNRFRALSQAAPDTADALDALLRRSRLDVELEDYDDLKAATPVLLARGDLGKSDHAEALALQSLAMIHDGDLPAAEKSIKTALSLIDAKDDATPPPPQNAAAVHFANGELLRARGSSIKFVPTPADFGAKMEARCQSILDAEDAYIEAIKTKDVRWAVRGGFRVASMYIALHDDLLVIPPPKSADTDARKSLFRGAMRLRYRILLEKGLGTLQHTLDLEQSTGVASVWFIKAREAKAQLEKNLADEKAEIAKLPYTEPELQKALDDLAKKPTKT